MSDQVTNESVTNRHQALLDRTRQFARDSRQFVRKLPKTLANIEDSKQLIRSSGSVAANGIEADEALSRKDFILRAKIVRKEAKESALWLDLVDTGTDPMLDKERKRLLNEANELKLIYNAIINKSEQGH